MDAVAEVLVTPPADPFAPEVIAVPGDGVRAWLTSELARRLGTTSGPDGARHDGILANVEFVFPAGLVARALGDPPESDPWSVGPLGWAVHSVLRADGERIGVTADAVRSRSIADLLDGYALHRPGMVRNWEQGNDVDVVGRRIPEHLAWQPRLWRALCERLGHPSGPASRSLAASELRTGRRSPDLPDRVVLFGLASMPPPHLEVLGALASRVEVHIVAPVWSLPVWQAVRGAVGNVVRRPPVERSADPTALVVAHPLGVTWGRTQREAQFLLALAAHEESAAVRALAPAPPPDSRTLLGLVQDALRDDRRPPGEPVDPSSDERPHLAVGDVSVRWHRCHGPGRQAEVIRDVVVRLLEEVDPHGRPRFEPRDIAVLCPEPAVFAATMQAVLAGDPDHGVPRVPFRVADRSLRSDAPLLSVVAGVLDLLDGRLRASDLMSLAASDPVARRFGFGREQLGQLADWVERTNIRWGADTEARRGFGIPEVVTAHTWQHGLDQVALGVALADPDLRPVGLDDVDGPGGATRLADVEGDVVEVFGAVADLVETVRDAVHVLDQPATPQAWAQSLVGAVGRLCTVADDEAWQWQQLERLIGGFVDAAAVGGGNEAPVPSAELATLFAAQLDGRPGRPRFGTGAVTLSSLTALRGVPHRVICIVGLDGDLGVGITRSDDLMAATPCVGDRDVRGERRAQLLDALLAAQERLVIATTGADVRTNAEVLPSIAVSELLDVLDATARPPSGSAATSVSSWIAVDHPRHAWSTANFRSGRLGVEGPWSFDRSALAAAANRAGGVRHRGVLDAALPRPPDAPILLDDVIGTLRNPVKTLLRQRLGVALHDEDHSIVDLIPVSLDPLERYQLRDELLAMRIAAGRELHDDEIERWADRRRRGGGLPPSSLGRGHVQLAREQVEALAADRERWCAPPAAVETVAVDLDLGDRRLVGTIDGVVDGRLVAVPPGSVSEHLELTHWFRLLVLAATDPERHRESVCIGLASTTTAKVSCTVRRITDPAEVARALSVVIDLHDRARCSVIPVLPATSKLLANGQDARAINDWRPVDGRRGNGRDPWVRFALGEVGLDELLEEPAPADESGPEWPTTPSRLRRWSQRIWNAVDASTEIVTEEAT